MASEKKRAARGAKSRASLVPQRLPPDRAWLAARKRLLSRIKQQVRRRLGPEPVEIQRFSSRLARELRAPWSVADKAELLASIAAADVIYGGDFHAFAQSQRVHLRILKSRQERQPRTARQRRDLIVGFEAIDVRHQDHLDAFVGGALTESELERKTRWKSEWGFPFENYLPLLEFCRATGARALALGTSRGTATLVEREAAAAERIAELFKSAPELRRPQVYVVFGELHLHRRHLPAEVLKRSQGLGLKSVVIHLNSEKLYFELAERGLETAVDVIRWGDERFCVLASPPWVQWQSYLMYLEKTHDADLEGTDRGEGLDDSDNFDHTEQVVSLMRLACQDLGLNFKGDDISVYTAADARLWRSLRDSLDRRSLGIARRMIESGRSFFIPTSGLFFLSHASVNHAAELAGQYLHSRLCGRSRPLWNLPGDFQGLIWTEAVGFFVSKLINHKRHAETLPDLRARLATLSPRDEGREPLLLALEQRLGELLVFHRGRRRKARLKPRDRLSWAEAARILGGMMGERLYLAFRSRNISLDALHRLLREDPSAAGFGDFYDEIVRRLGPGTGALRTRKERL